MYAYGFGRDLQETSCFSWIPAEISIDVDNNTAKFTSYVNNLQPHPIAGSSPQLGQLSEDLATTFAKVYPKLNTVLDRRVPMGQQFCDKLQIVVKITEYDIPPEGSYVGMWHAEGLPQDQIVASVIWYEECDAHVKGEMCFKATHSSQEHVAKGPAYAKAALRATRLVQIRDRFAEQGIEDLFDPQDFRQADKRDVDDDHEDDDDFEKRFTWPPWQLNDPNSLDSEMDLDSDNQEDAGSTIADLQDTANALQEYISELEKEGACLTPAESCIVLPNYLQQQLRLFNVGDTPAKSRVVSFFVVNPAHRVVSSKHIAPQHHTISLDQASTHRSSFIADHQPRVIEETRKMQRSSDMLNVQLSEYLSSADNLQEEWGMSADAWI